MIDWSNQHCGVHHCPFEEMILLMPDIEEVFADFPDKVSDFTFDVKVHMLFPRQFPCIPNWHVDNVPRINGIQRFDLIRPELPMYAWISGPPLTQFQYGYLTPRVWHRFTQVDQHRGTMADNFVWRGFIRACHKELMPPKDKDFLRRHSQVYCDSEKYQW